MRILAIFLIISILGLAAFGLIPMDHGTHHGMSDFNQPTCPLATLVQANCVTGQPMAFVHISALQSFLNSPVASASAALLLLVLCLYLSYRLLNIQRSRLRLCSVYAIRKKAAKPSEEKLLSWISLFENSPAIE